MHCEESWTHPALYTREVSKKGLGVFSRINLPKGTCVGRPAGGAIYTTEETLILVPRWGDYFHQVGDYFHWGPIDEKDVDMLDRMNHSCDPTVWWDGDMQIITRREIRAHKDELTWDYATTESYAGYGFPCHCGTALCRGRMDADDWKRLELQIRYYGHFGSYLRRKVDDMLRENHFAVKNGKLYFIDDYDAHAPHWHEVIGNEKGVVVNRRSAFQHIQILMTKYGRMLVLDGFPQLAELDRPVYTESLGLPPLLLVQGNNLRAYLFGAGDGDLLSFVLRDPRIKKAIMVEIDEEVISATQQHMPFCWESALPHLRSGRAEIRIENALDFLEKERQKAHIIYWDLTGQGEGDLATPLMTVECFQKVANLLTDDGILAMQSDERTPHFSKTHGEIEKIVRRVFPHTIAGSEYVGSFNTKWGFLLASRQAIPWLGSQLIVRDLLRTRPELTSIPRYMTPERLAAMFA